MPLKVRSARHPFPPPTARSEELVVANMKLAYDRAHRYARLTGVPVRELESVALLGLIRGCRGYDPDRINPHTGQPYALSSCVVPHIDGYIRHHFRDNAHLVRFPQAWRMKWTKARRMAERGTVLHQIAEEVGLPVREVAELLKAMAASGELPETLAAVDHHPVHECYLPELEQHVHRAWGSLSEADQRMLARWVAAGRGAPPQGPLGRVDKALQKLRKGQPLQSYHARRLI